MPLDILSRLARPGSPLHRIMQRRIAGAGSSGYMGPGGYGVSSMDSATSPSPRASAPRFRTGPAATGFGATGGGGSLLVNRGDFQGGGYPAGGPLHLNPSTRLSPSLRFGKAVSTSNGYSLTHPSIPGMIAGAARVRATHRGDAVGMRGPW